MNAYRNTTIPDLTPTGVWVDSLPCLCLTRVEREWFTNEALEWLGWWERLTPEQQGVELERSWYDGNQ